MDYPGHIIAAGNTETGIITAVQQQLNQKGCGPLAVSGVFDAATGDAIKLFQARFTDQHDNPLTVDGIVGPVTWATLFGSDTVSSVTKAPNVLLTQVLAVAASQVGVMESPPGSNNGPDVNKYQDAAGAPHGDAWCMAFVFWCFMQASKNLGIPNPAVKTAGVLDMWNRATCKKVPAASAVSNTSLVLPGQIFIISTGGGHGHTGLIERIDGGLLTTIEGNTNNSGSREGIGVFRRKARTINSINEGYLEYPL